MAKAKTQEQLAKQLAKKVLKNAHKGSTITKSNVGSKGNFNYTVQDKSGDMQNIRVAPDGTVMRIAGAGSTKTDEERQLERMQAQMEAYNKELAATSSPAEERPTVPSYMDDEGYQQALAALGRQWANYTGDIQLSKDQFSTDYADQVRRFGYNPETGQFNNDPRQTDYGRDFSANQGDFASRGTYWSGGRHNAEQDLDQTYIDRGQAMKRSKDNYMKSLDRQLLSEQAAYDERVREAQRQALDRKLLETTQRR